MDDLQRKDEAIRAMMDVEYCPTFQDAEAEEKQYTKLPWGELASLGVGFASMPTAVRTITETVTATLGPNVFQRVDGLNMGLLHAKNMPGLFRGVAQNGPHMDGGTLFKPMATAGAVQSVTVPFDPTVVLMAAALMSINQKLDEIQETQREILDYLKAENRAKLKGDLNTLADVMNNYKYNWNNTMYVTNQHSKVLDIKQDAEQGIILHQDQISRILKKKSFLHSDQDVHRKLQGIRSELQDYKLALYVFGFAAFLEVMLLKNFKKEYLDGIVAKIENYSMKYRELYTECCNELKEESDSSIETTFLGGIAQITKGAGDVIARIPVISQGQLDEVLIDAGKWLSKTQKGKISKQMRSMAFGKKEIVKPFIDNINAVNKLYNEPLEFYFNQENLYLQLPQSI